MRIPADEPPPPPPPSRPKRSGALGPRERRAPVGVQGSPTIIKEELELDREMEYFVEPEGFYEGPSNVSFVEE